METAKRPSLLQTLGSILKDNWEWKSQIWHLSIFELKKRARGAALGWAWLLVRPLIFIFVFWFALEIGLRAGSKVSGDYPYYIWLISGLIPWFFMQEMLSTGSNVLHRYPYLVKKVKFPLSAISTIYVVSSLIVNLMLFAILLIIYFAHGMPLDIYLLQIPLIYALMMVFWWIFSILTSQLSGMSKDFSQLMKSLTQPLFWLSGVIYNISMLVSRGFRWAADLMLFNPVTFFVTAFRDATCEKIWFWNDPKFIGCFAIVFGLTLLFMLIVYRRHNKEVGDAL